MPQILPKSQQNDDKYKDKFVRFLNKGDHYELIFTDRFDTPDSTFDPNTTLIDIVSDLNNVASIFFNSSSFFGGKISNDNTFFLF